MCVSRVGLWKLIQKNISHTQSVAEKLFAVLNRLNKDYSNHLAAVEQENQEQLMKLKRDLKVTPLEKPLASWYKCNIDVTMERQLAYADETIKLVSFLLKRNNY